MMKDISGFLLLILVMFAGLYITVRLVVPLLFIYAAGIIAFYMISRRLMKKGRRHPGRLNCYLKPGYAPGLAACAIGIPAVHVLLVYFLRLSEHWLEIGAANIIPPVIWTARTLWLHMRQGRRYIVEGFNIEEMLEASRSRAGLLDLKIEILTAAAETEGDPEPWEYAIGLPFTAAPDRHEEITILINKMKELREMYQNLSDELDEHHRTKEKVPWNRHATDISIPTESRLKRLDLLWREVSRESSKLLTETVGYSSYGWDATV